MNNQVVADPSWIEANPALFVVLIIAAVALAGLTTWMIWRDVQAHQRRPA